MNPVILQLIAFAIAEGPAAFEAVLKIINGIKANSGDTEAQVKALQSVLAALSPMVKEP